MPLDNLTYTPATGPAADLLRAKALINRREKWFGLDNRWKRDTHCMFTAIHKSCDYKWQQIDVMSGLVRTVIGGRIETFNDTHTHAECMVVMDEAIELARAAELERTGK